MLNAIGLCFVFAVSQQVLAMPGGSSSSDKSWLDRSEQSTAIAEVSSAIRGVRDALEEVRMQLVERSVQDAWKYSEERVPDDELLGLVTTEQERLEKYKTRIRTETTQFCYTETDEKE